LNTIDGWLTSLDASLVVALAKAQRSLGVRGSVGEIGIHHGKLFVLLALTLDEGERAFAIDLFQEQDQNDERSGFGDEAVFRRNLQLFEAPQDRIDTLRGNSLQWTWPRIAPAAGMPARLFSVDGGHGADVVQHDLGIADAGLAEAGVVIVDDYFNTE